MLIPSSQLSTVIPSSDPEDPLGWHLVDPQLPVGGAGVVHEGAEAAETVGGPEQGGDVVGGGDVGRHGQRLDAFGPAGGHHVLGRPGRAPVGEAHRPALGGQPPGRGRPDTPAAARHHRHLFHCSHLTLADRPSDTLRSGSGSALGQCLAQPSMRY